MQKLYVPTQLDQTTVVGRAYIMSRIDKILVRVDCTKRYQSLQSFLFVFFLLIPKILNRVKKKKRYIFQTISITSCKKKKSSIYTYILNRSKATRFVSSSYIDERPTLRSNQDKRIVILVNNETPMHADRRFTFYFSSNCYSTGYYYFI